MEAFGNDLQNLREKQPLVHNITNFVVMNVTANALLALGASPVMAHAQNEVEDMVTFAGALVLNIGTLTDDWVEVMILAGRKANAIGVPVILDPVGSGATPLRTRSAKRILDEVRVAVIRGNASEILSLRDASSQTKGVDSLNTVDEAGEIAQTLAQELNTCLAITGPVDWVTDGQRVLRVANGHPLMARITGTGCTATAICGAFMAVDSDVVQAVAAGLACWGLAGEWSARENDAPGSMMVGMLDALYRLTPDEFTAQARVEEIRV